MRLPQSLRARRAEWLADAIAFVVMLVTAHSRDMDARDLVWGLWLASLTAGVVFFFGTILVSRASPFRDKDIKNPLVAVGVTLVVFVLFCLAHGLVHQTLFMFLMAFLPYGANLDELAADPHGGLHLFARLYADYWPIVLITLASWGLVPVFRPKQKPKPGDIILPMPIGSLVRQVLVIFLLAGMHMLGLTAWAYYPVLCVLYLPVETWLKRWSEVTSRPAR
ncbi:MAG: hypothetical protein JXR37_26120 [Kiritimatiellae bacterium]|nr:hypothetical protein [Kiritimatiellia bacterium]